MIVQADILNWAASYEGAPFHAAFMDAPYEMEFMGRSWDASGIAFNPDTWRAIARHLHPGAFLFVFAGTINDDLISVAMREAGLRKHHKALAWCYGSGMKKGARVDAQLDRAVGATRPVVGTKKHAPKFDAAGFGHRKKDNGFNSKTRKTFDLTAPATDLAATWEGYSYGLQTLAPAAETILIFQKPYAGAAVMSIATAGAGAINIAAGRFGADEIRSSGAISDGWRMQEGRTDRQVAVPSTSIGRWPKNALLSHHPACTPVACADGCGVQCIGAQSGESVSRAAPRGEMNSGCLAGIVDTGPSPKPATNTVRGHDDVGTAARYFFNADWTLDRLEDAPPFVYEPKASGTERDAFLEAFPVITVDDGRETPIDNALLRGMTLRRNPHPCLKPLSLNKYLAGLLLPPDAYAPRRLLVPFAGVASEYIGAMLAGWDEIVGVEITADYIPYAEARIAGFRQAMRRLHTTDPAVILEMREQAQAPTLFDYAEEAT